MNKYTILTSFLLTSSILFSVPAKSNNELLEESDELVIIEKVGRSNYLLEKAKRTAEALRLSDKGDLPSDSDLSLRRRFYTLPDGDCFFWAVDQTREAAKTLWLQHAHDIAIRKLAAQEIYDEFMDGRLPEALKKMPLYKELKEVNDIAIELLDGSQDRLFRRDVLTQKAQIENRIKTEFCESEAVYRAYVLHGLGTNQNYMLHAHDFGGNCRTYFVDVLAHLRQKNLVIWAYSEDRQRLIKAHEYRPQRADATWEVVYERNHYTRVVRTSDGALLNHGKLKKMKLLTNKLDI